jgi:hypothetical protein
MSQALLALSAVTAGTALWLYASSGLARLSRWRWLAQAQRRFDALIRHTEVERQLTQPLSAEELYRLPRINWAVPVFLYGLVGLGITTMTFDTMPLARLVGLATAAIPLVIRSRWRVQGERQLRKEVRCFLSDLRLALALNCTPEQALYYVVLHGGVNAAGILPARLGHYVRAGLSPDKALERLAEGDWPDDMRECLERASAALRGAGRVDLLDRASVTWLDRWTQADQELHSARRRLAVWIVSGLLDSLALALLPTLIGWMTAPR